MKRAAVSTIIMGLVALSADILLAGAVAYYVAKSVVGQ